MQDEDIFCRKCGFEFVENNVTLQKTDVGIIISNNKSK